jgi:uncharacterized membrane protein
MINVENVITVYFNVESEAYQSFSELKNAPYNTEPYAIAQAALVRNEGGQIKVMDGFNADLGTVDDSIAGGFIGTMIGIIGGPIGMLLGGSMGYLLGSVIDTGEEIHNVSLLEQIATRLQEGEVAIIVLAKETDESFLDARMQNFDTVLTRHDAAVVKKELEEAILLQDELQRQVRRDLRNHKINEHKERIEESKMKIRQYVKAVKNKYNL